LYNTIDVYFKDILNQFMPSRVAEEGSMENRNGASGINTNNISNIIIYK